MKQRWIRKEKVWAPHPKADCFWTLCISDYAPLQEFLEVGYSSLWFEPNQSKPNQTNQGPRCILLSCGRPLTAYNLCQKQTAFPELHSVTFERKTTALPDACNSSTLCPEWRVLVNPFNATWILCEGSENCTKIGGKSALACNWL